MPKLVEAMERAAEGAPGSLKEFYVQFLADELFVPVAMVVSAHEIPLVGKNAESAFHFTTVRQGPDTVLPVFTQPEFVEVWAEREWPFEKIAVAALLQVIGSEMHLHLNPGQEIGREFTPWELSLLRNGIDAVDELVADAQSERSLELEVETHSSLFPELKKRMSSILEAYDGIEEAFLISVKEAGSSQPSPVLGLRHEDLPQQLLERACSEIQEQLSELLQPGQELTIVEDMKHAKNHLVRLFEDATPFYFRGHKMTEPPGLKERISSFFGRKSIVGGAK